MNRIAGIDYGSKLAGTTVIAWNTPQGQIQLLQSKKKQDADQMILRFLKEESIDLLGIDAPLSLPGALQKLPHFDNFFYRKADQELSAMSPMFLGGLTARAMKLTHQIHAIHPTRVLEVYPGGLARKFEFGALNYKKEKEQIPVVLEQIKKELPYQIEQDCFSNWHQVDALLCLWSVWRYINNQHVRIGDPIEGQIIL